MTSSNKSPRNVHYVLSTHWDREWYQPFQDYRYRLVQLIDHMIEGFDHQTLKGPFQQDGQAILLEDYLEVRPNLRKKVENLVETGKFVVGPWYVLPDEFLISGESHLRNLRLGRQIARDFGGTPSDAGFACDLFGHISQMPQIFAGFGIQTSYLWRGINLDKQRHFIWEGTDGTETACFCFSREGYGDFTFKVREAHKPELEFDAEDKRKKLDAFLATEAEETELSPILLFDGCDHQEWDQQFYPIVAERFGKTLDGLHYQHTSLDAYNKELLAGKDQISTRFKGELRDPGKTLNILSAHQIHGVLSSRAPQKQQNAQCESLLCQWAEPLSSFASQTLGLEYPEGFLNVAWRWLMKNHPHDSICGCSVDTVHQDMEFRFSQTRQIAERLTLEASRSITANIEGDINVGEVRVTLFNPTARNFDGTTEIDLEVPTEYQNFNEFFGYEGKPSFLVLDHKGNELPYQRLNQDMGRSRWRIDAAKITQGVQYNEIRVSLKVHIPANGYTTLTVKNDPDHQFTRYPQETGLITTDRSMENENIAVRFESNGTLTMTDKRSGEVYTDLLTFEDRADIGDGWFHGLAVNDQIYVSSGCQSEIALTENGPNVSAFRVRTTMLLPEEFDFSSMKRVERRKEFVFDSIVRLRPGTDYLEVETTVDNKIKDHRVRVMFPSGTKSDVYFTDTPFDVIERKIALPEDACQYRELPVETQAMQNWCAVEDGKRGLAVIAPGQYEGCVRDLENRPLALTLFRSTRRTIGTPGEPGGQLQDVLKFRYLVKALPGKIDRKELFLQAQLQAAGLRAVQLRNGDQKMFLTDKTLPATDSMFGIEGRVVVTSSRFADGELEIRFFNPETDTTQAVITLNETLNYTKSQLVDFESKPIGETLPLSNSSISLAVEAKKIRTVRFS